MLRLLGLAVAVVMLAGAGTPSVPGPLTSMTATAAYDTAGFYWHPGNDGGGTIVRYELSRDDGATWSTLRTEELYDRWVHARIDGLHVDQEYVFHIRAVNQLGPGERIRWALQPSPRSPDAPADVTVKPLDRGVDVSFRAPPHRRRTGDYGLRVQRRRRHRGSAPPTSSVPFASNATPGPIPTPTAPPATYSP